MTVLMRVQTVLTYGTGGPGLNTVYWAPGTPGGVTADATDAVARVRAMWLAMAGQFPTTFAFGTSNDVSLIDDSDGALVGSLGAASVASVVGTGGASSGPLASMFLVRLRTGLIRDGRLVRGRWYLGPVSAAAIHPSGSLVAAAQTALNSASTALLTGGATGSVPSVWHRPNSHGAGASSPVLTTSTWSQFATMRSRRDA